MIPRRFGVSIFKRKGKTVMNLTRKLIIIFSATHCILAKTATAIDLSGLDTSLATTDTHERELLHAHQQTHRSEPCIPPFILLAQLINLAQLNTLLQYDIYEHTNPIYIRSVHTEPSTTIRSQLFPECTYSVTCKPYIRYTPHAYLTHDSSRLGSYITLLREKSFLDQIDNSYFTQLSIPSVLPLFGNMRVEGRELGAMFAAQAWYGSSILFNIIAPILYLEYNFKLSQADTTAIEESPLFSSSTSIGPTPSRDFSTFKEEHLLSDKAGLGDVRFELWYNGEAAPDERSAIGGQLTLPTAKAVLTGIVAPCAARLNIRDEIPFVDLNELGQLYCRAQLGEPGQKVLLAETVVDLGVAALDRLSSILLNNPLGQQHASIGTVFRLERCIHPSVRAHVTGEVSYYIPSAETRCFLVKKDPAAFDRDYNNPDLALENLDFLSQQATNTLYPSAVNLRVHPGWIFNITGLLEMSAPHYRVNLGCDVWGKTKESFGPLHFHYSPGSPCGPFNLDKGKLGNAFQIKLFGSITSEIKSEHSYNARIGLRGDATVYSIGIGRDLVLAGDFIIDF